MVRIFFTFIVFLFSVQLVQADLLRVSPEWLKSNLNNSDIIILDGRPKNEYLEGHVSGAFSFPDALTYQQKSQGGRIVEADVMQQLLRERGIDYNKTIIVYDGGQLKDAARLFWALEVYGLQNVKVMSTGYDDWKKKKFPTSTSVPSAKVSNYVVSVNHHRIASKFSTQLATKNPKQVIIDARDVDSYAGKKSTAKRFGHIPTAINIPITHNIEKVNDVNSLRTIDQLKEIYSNIPQSSKVVTYCEIGRASSTIYLALRELGYDVSNYDASWREWGNDFSLPIEK